MSKNNLRQETAQEFINVEAIERNILWTRDKLLFCFIRVKGRDNSLLDGPAHAQLTQQLSVAMGEQRTPFQILSIPRTADVRGMLQELNELYKSAKEETRRQLLEGEIQALEEMEKNRDKEPMLLIKLWQKAAPGADQDLLERAGKLARQLIECGISAQIMSDDQILHLCTIFAELGIFQPDDTETDVPILKGTKRLFTRKATPEEVAHNELMEQITPMGGLFFRQDHLLIGSAWCKCFGVSRFPAEVDFNWAAPLTGATDCITCITYHPGMEGVVAELLSRTITSNESLASATRDVRQRKSLQRKADAADKLLDEVDGKHKAIGQLSITVMPFAPSKEALDVVCKTVTDRFSRRRMKLKLLSAVQKEAFKHLSPYYPDQTVINDMTQRIFPMETLMGGYPMTINTLRDDHGFYFGRTRDYGIVTFDPKVRNLERNNGIGIVTGKSGKGKSTFLKHYIQSLYMMGFQIIIIDPEREYRDLCKALGGAWLDTGGGKYKLNPLQIQAPLPDDEEDDEYKSNVPPLAQHLQTVQMLLQYKIPSLTDTQLSLLMRALRELYRNFGITNEWAYEPSRPADQYPIMEDLYRLLEQKVAEDPRYSDLALLIEDMAIGADSVIWNGHTNISVSNQVIVYDTNRLQSSSESNRVAQYYNLMRLSFSAMSADRTTPVALFCDESQIIFDPRFPQVSGDMKNIVLRARKYEGHVWLSFPTLKTLKDERVGFNGQPIIDTADYKILFGTDGQNLKDTVELMHLNESEEVTLEHLQRGEALAILAKLHIKIEFDIPKYKLRLMGKAGGR